MMRETLADVEEPSKRPMDLAFAEAEAAGLLGEVPIGAVVVSASGEVLARAGNRTLELRDPTAHAELLAIREACARLGSERLIDCDLYVTLEPCAMCAAAISFARLRRLYFGAAGPQGRRRRAWPALLRAAHLPSRARNLWRHRRGPRRRAPEALLRRAAVVMLHRPAASTREDMSKSDALKQAEGR